ncbi:uncharacterized protein LOC114531460 [Dendronephthya gigantea]|uniref:uncharacterized protein LOC114531460 n=1 Tax=Dendronephthya gigantea TaxID=151771 RepID=UPI00106CAC63|nr:uncharacterized protein LOC114531460 [Dendronephthya gigantea]
MNETVEAFVVFMHASVSGRILPEHFNFTFGKVPNFICVNSANREFETCLRLVEMFSHSGDWILDVNLPEAGGVAAVTIKRNCLILVKTEEEEREARRKLKEL